MAVGHHLAGRRLRGGHHRDRAFGMAFVEVLRVGGVENVEAKIKIGAAVGNLVRSVERRVGDLDVGNHRAALLREARLVETDDVLAFEPRRVGQGRHDSHRAGPTDAHDVNTESEAGVDLGHRIRQCLVERGDATLLFLFRRVARGRIGVGSDGQERRAEALDAGEVLVARTLVDARLATELGRHRFHAHAV